MTSSYAEGGRGVGPRARRGHLVGLIEARLGRRFVDEATALPFEDRVAVSRDRLLTLLSFLKSDPDADLSLLVDVTCLDRHREPAQGAPRARATPSRFSVVYRLRSPRLSYRLLVTVTVPDDDPVVPSATPLFRAADWLERELWDLFGVYPDGHPYLRRLLLYSGFSGHPLRKDYPFAKSQPLVPLREPPLPPDVMGCDGDESPATEDG